MARLIRYAAAFVVCFTRREDAKPFRMELTERLAQFDLAVEPRKTKVLAFGLRDADENVIRARLSGRGVAEITLEPVAWFAF